MEASTQTTNTPVNVDVTEFVIKAFTTAGQRGKIAKGLRQVTKSLMRNEAKVCVLSKGVNDENYKNLITGLCVKNNIPLYLADDNMVLGEMAGVHRHNKAGLIKKKLPCGTATITKWGKNVGEIQNQVVGLAGGN